MSAQIFACASHALKPVAYIFYACTKRSQFLKNAGCRILNMNSLFYFQVSAGRIDGVIPFVLFRKQSVFWMYLVKDVIGPRKTPGLCDFILLLPGHCQNNFCVSFNNVFFVNVSICAILCPSRS